MKLFSLLLVSLFAVSAFGKTMLDTSKSQVMWKGTKVFKSDMHAGTINVKSGFVTMEGMMIKGGEIVIDMNSMVTTDKMSEKAKGNLIAHLKNDDFFATDKHPEAKFTIKSVAKKGKAQVVKGELMIRGKKGMVEVPMMVKKDGSTMMASGTMKFDRTKFDVKYNSKSLFPNLVKSAKDKVIDDMIEIKLSLVAPAMAKK